MAFDDKDIPSWLRNSVVETDKVDQDDYIPKWLEEAFGDGPTEELPLAQHEPSGVRLRREEPEPKQVGAEPREEEKSMREVPPSMIASVLNDWKNWEKGLPRLKISLYIAKFKDAFKDLFGNFIVGKQAPSLEKLVPGTLPIVLSEIAQSQLMQLGETVEEPTDIILCGEPNKVTHADKGDLDILMVTHGIVLDKEEGEKEINYIVAANKISKATGLPNLGTNQFDSKFTEGGIKVTIVPRRGASGEKPVFKQSTFGRSFGYARSPRDGVLEVAIFRQKAGTKELDRMMIIDEKGDMPYRANDFSVDIIE